MVGEFGGYPRMQRLFSFILVAGMATALSACTSHSSTTSPAQSPLAAARHQLVADLGQCTKTFGYDPNNTTALRLLPGRAGLSVGCRNGYGGSGLILCGVQQAFTCHPHACLFAEGGWLRTGDAVSVDDETMGDALLVEFQSVGDA